MRTGPPKRGPTRQAASATLPAGRAALAEPVPEPGPGRPARIRQRPRRPRSLPRRPASRGAGILGGGGGAGGPEEGEGVEVEVRVEGQAVPRARPQAPARAGGRAAVVPRQGLRVGVGRGAEGPAGGLAVGVVEDEAREGGGEGGEVEQRGPLLQHLPEGEGAAQGALGALQTRLAVGAARGRAVRLAVGPNGAAWRAA